MTQSCYDIRDNLVQLRKCLDVHSAHKINGQPPRQATQNEMAVAKEPTVHRDKEK